MSYPFAGGICTLEKFNFVAPTIRILRFAVIINLLRRRMNIEIL